MNLNGTWKLYYFPQGNMQIEQVTDLATRHVPSIPCTVPGNVELDLSAAGILPADLFKGENVLEAQKFENYEWWYETSFEAPAIPDNEHRVILHFGAVDCLATYYLNGEKIGESDNMFIAQDFDVTDRLRYAESNTLHVHIRSAIFAGAEYDIDPDLLAYTWHLRKSSLHIRKAPHGYGWDIMPRAISAGIWRDVELRYEKKYDFKYLYFDLARIDGNRGYVRLLLDAALKPEHAYADITYVINGRCGEQTFTHTAVKKGGAVRVDFAINDIKLWWPRNYGESNLYDITVEAFDKAGEKLLSKTVRRGFRTVELRRSDAVEENGCFEFVVNGVRIMAVGSNWVPMDAYHSRDKERYAKALEMAVDVNCNILRCWGGNVYEDHAFFDFCDENGIMVWQDFAMACAYYPQTEDFYAKMKSETEWVVKELRDHPSLILWSGDNEIDQMLHGHGCDPERNHITRELLPRVLERLDPFRPYLPSSPYITPAVRELGTKFCPEDHLWGPRGYYKADYYTKSQAYFVSEIGYHGCPARESIEKFIDKEYVWPPHNPQWILHSSDQSGNPGRVNLMHNQIRHLFGDVPDNLDDFALASQIVQAEAKKFFIERMRSQMARNGGIIWWNLVDGWPQMSDAVVDYYYAKKLAYDYIKRSSQPFIIMLTEPENGEQTVLCANSTLHAVSGTCAVSELDTGKMLFETAFTAALNANTVVGTIPVPAEQKMLLVRWETNSGKAFNTYLCGMPTFSLEEYKGWLKKLLDA